MSARRTTPSLIGTPTLCRTPTPYSAGPGSQGGVKGEGLVRRAFRVAAIYASLDAMPTAIIALREPPVAGTGVSSRQLPRRCHDDVVSLVEVIEGIGSAIDAIGVAVIAGGGLLALAMTFGKGRRDGGGAYVFFRQQLGRAILLGLEFLVAADIIRTVAVTPTGESVLVLGGIVLIRTFLSFSLELEMTGAWPWQQRSVAASDKSHGHSAD
jgi:uncharacterized membrane protein